MNQTPLKTASNAILSDPVAAYRAQHSQPDDEALGALTALSHQATALRQQHKQTQIRTGILSRQIGEAKRADKPVDGLIASMQEHSARLKHLDDDLSEVQRRILAFFEAETASPAGDQPTPAPTEADAAAIRRYDRALENTDDIRISLLTDEADEWNRYVMRNPAASVHHRAEWRDLLQQCYDLEGFYLLARDAAETVVGILPLVRLRSRLFGDFMVSMPYFSRGGAIADHPLIERKLMQAANDHAARLKLDHVEYRDDIPRTQLPSLTHKVNMMLSLPASTDALWRGFSSKLRAQIRRPQRENPQMLCGGKELLDDFYRVYTRNMRDLGSPAHSKRFVHAILDAFPGRSWIIVLRLRQRPVAAGFLLAHTDTLEIPLASTVRDVNALSMNMLLYWEVLKFAIEHGFSEFDFGRSSRDTGTYRFKRQWGAQPRQLYWHYWLGDGGELPALNPANPKYALAISIWKRLPLALTRWLGPSLVKHLP